MFGLSLVLAKPPSEKWWNCKFTKCRHDTATVFRRQRFAAKIIGYGASLLVFQPYLWAPNLSFYCATATMIKDNIPSCSPNQIRKYLQRDGKRLIPLTSTLTTVLYQLPILLIFKFESNVWVCNFISLARILLWSEIWGLWQFLYSISQSPSLNKPHRHRTSQLFFHFPRCFCFCQNAKKQN